MEKLARRSEGGGVEESFSHGFELFNGDSQRFWKIV
jgi:hypothetical protein